ANVERYVPDRSEVPVRDVELLDTEDNRRRVARRLVMAADVETAAQRNRGGGGGLWLGDNDLGHDDLFFSKRLRRTMAIELINKTVTSIAMIAAEALSTLNSACGSLANVVTIVGKAVNRSSRWAGLAIFSS